MSEWDRYWPPMRRFADYAVWAMVAIAFLKCAIEGLKTHGLL